MKTREVLEGLERECGQLGVKLVYDDLHGEGGWCRVKEKYQIIINRRTSAESRIRIIREALLEVRRRTQEATEPQAPSFPCALEEAAVRTGSPGPANGL